LEEVVSGFVSKASPRRQAEYRYAQDRNLESRTQRHVGRKCGRAPSPQRRKPLRGNKSKPFSKILPDASMSPSRFWNIRTQAEQTSSESGSRDSGEESMCDPLTRHASLRIRAYLLNE
jgi:hypothetical protein